MSTLMAHPKMRVTLRSVCAIVGGYALSAAGSMLLASLFDMQTRENDVFVRMVFFTLYTLFIIMAFSVNRDRRVYIGTVVLNALAWGVLMLVQGSGQ